MNIVASLEARWVGLDKNVILMFCVWFECGCGSSSGMHLLIMASKTKFRHVKVRTCEGPDLHMYQLSKLDHSGPIQCVVSYRDQCAHKHTSYIII